MESFAVALLRLFRQLVGRKIVPLAASFVHHRSDGRKIERILGCDVSFDAYEDAMRFDASVMDLPLVGYDPYLNNMMVKDCEDAIAARAPNISPFRTEVENIIAPLLPHAEAQARRSPTARPQRKDLCPPVGSRGVELWRNPRPNAARTRRAISGRKPSSFTDRLAARLPAAQRLQPCMPALDRQEPLGVSAGALASLVNRSLTH